MELLIQRGIDNVLLTLVGQGETKEYLESESVDYWLNFKENYVSVNNIYNMVMVEDQPINISKDLQKIDIQKISNDEMLLSKFDYVPGKDTCFTNFASVFLKKEDVEEAKKIFKEANVIYEPFEGVTFRAFFKKQCYG